MKKISKSIRNCRKQYSFPKLDFFQILTQCVHSQIEFMLSKMTFSDNLLCNFWAISRTLRHAYIITYLWILLKDSGPKKGEIVQKIWVCSLFWFLGILLCILDCEVLCHLWHSYETTHVSFKWHKMTQHKNTQNFFFLTW